MGALASGDYPVSGRMRIARGESRATQDIITTLEDSGSYERAGDRERKAGTIFEQMKDREKQYTSSDESV